MSGGRWGKAIWGIGLGTFTASVFGYTILAIAGKGPNDVDYFDLPETKALEEITHRQHQRATRLRAASNVEHGRDDKQLKADL